MKTYHTFFMLFFIAQSSNIFSQLDSVYYKGPSQGSVNSGAIQSTNNFTDNYFIAGDEVNEIILNSRSMVKNQNLIFGWNSSKLPEHKYVEDSPAEKSNSGNGGQTVPA